MKHAKVLSIIAGTAGMLFLPALLQGQPDTKAEVDRHFQQQMVLKDDARRIKMDIADLEGKLGATILMGSDRDGLMSQLSDDRNKLRSDRAALHEGLTYLTAHWDLLSESQRSEVREEERSLE
ncbi:MAG TPA: hypothetical protein VHE12_11075 [bacterium]|nr:hypothetical protein [bacterium]